MRDVERLARDIGGAKDQIPYAISQSLNDAAFKVRDHFINETWPQHVQVRDRNFIRNAMRVDKADKRKLVVAVTTEGASAGSRAHLALHDTGGTKQAKGRLAIPDPKIRGRRGAKGMTQSLRPANLANAFVKGDVIYQRIKTGKKKGLRLLYVLKPQATMKADVPFRRDAEAVFRREVRASFPKRMMAAMRSRRA